jgi:hypothetical protein
MFFRRVLKVTVPGTRNKALCQWLYIRLVQSQRTVCNCDHSTRKETLERVKKPSEGSRRAGRTYHVADVIGILVAETVDGELSEICLRLSVVAIP